MGTGLIATGVCRYTCEGLYGGRPVANVFDLYVVPLGGADRGDVVQDVAELVLDSFVTAILPRVVNDYSFTAVSWVDLDSASGTVGRITSTGAHTLPITGGDTGDPMPGNVAVRALKGITAARGQRQGRCYFVGVAEPATSAGDPNNLTSSVISGWNTALAAFLSALNAAATTYDCFMAVVHTHLNKDVTPPVLEWTGTSPVQTFTCDTRLATQRRRLRG